MTGWISIGQQSEGRAFPDDAGTKLSKVTDGLKRDMRQRPGQEEGMAGKTGFWP